MKHRLLAFIAVVLFSAPAPQRLSAQSDLRALAATAATAWTAHDFAGVVGAGRVEVRIPGVSAAGPLPSDQAVALLVNHVRGAEEVEVTVVTVLAISEVSGYAELRRRFRQAGVGGHGASPRDAGAAHATQPVTNSSRAILRIPRSPTVSHAGDAGHAPCGQSQRPTSYSSSDTGRVLQRSWGLFADWAGRGPAGGSGLLGRRLA